MKKLLATLAVSGFAIGLAATGSTHSTAQQSAPRVVAAKSADYCTRTACIRRGVAKGSSEAVARAWCERNNNAC